jgi:uncharacterized protein
MKNKKTVINRDLTAVGALFISVSSECALFLLRDQDTYSNTWSLVGGKLESNETLYGGLIREIKEEIGFEPTILKVLPIEYFQSPDGHFNYHTFAVIVPTEFIPTLSKEHKGFAWCKLDNPPKPLHPGLYRSLQNKVIKDKLSTIKNILEIAF